MFRRSVTLFVTCVSLTVVLVSARLSSTTLFKPVESYSSGGANAISVAVSDLNGDGNPDVIVANGCIACGTGAPFGVGVLLGNGDGTFQAAQTYDLNGLSVESVAVADANQDGKPDLLATTACFSNSDCGSGGVWVLLGNGDGTFQAAVTYSSGGYVAEGMAVVDVNGDGMLDLLVANCAPVASFTCALGSGSVAVLLGNGNGTFQPALTYGSGGQNARLIAVGDVNGDTKPDVVVENCAPVGGGCESFGVDTIVAVLLGNGDGTFQPATTYDSGGGSGSGIAIADLNGDGKPDLVVSNGDVAVLLGNGDGTFQPANTYNSGGSGAEGLAAADVNRDGKVDLLVTNYFCGRSYNCDHGVVAVLLGNGDGTFQPATAYDSGGYGAFALFVADVNKDFGPDIVIANNCGVGGDCTTGVVGVLLNYADTTPPAITLSVTPKILWPPNGRPVPVTLSGTITDTGSGVNASTAEYSVQDEYGEVQPFGKIALDAAGNYSFTILLRAGRRDNDLNGRQYTIRVSAKDNAGNRGVRWARVTVPYGQPH